MNIDGVLYKRFSDKQLQPVRNEIDKMLLDLNKQEPANSFLSGNIEREYVLKESKDHIAQLMAPLIDEHTNKFNYFKDISILSENRHLVLDRAWVNFQKKYEFNPNHNHIGVFSFVIWINLPYSLEDEREHSPGKKSNNNVAGCFEFLYTDTLVRISNYTIACDKSQENMVLLFPSKMIHCVYPFYTSDDYRITVSGNFKFKV